MTRPAGAMLHRLTRALGPAIAPGSPREAVRAGIGALVGLGVSGLFLLSPMGDLRIGFYMIAPFGATSVLVFAAPNSPLAQPWSAVVGTVLMIRSRCHDARIDRFRSERKDSGV